VRGVSFPDLRLREGRKLGFDRFFVPMNNQRHLKGEKEVAVEWLTSIKELQKVIK
jgi:predicted ATP-dependent serine protease